MMGLGDTAMRMLRPGDSHTIVAQIVGNQQPYWHSLVFLRPRM